MYNNLSESVSTTKGERMNFLMRTISQPFRFRIINLRIPLQNGYVNSYPASLFSINAEMVILLAT